jgi:Mg2+/citrate symporter
MTVKAFLPTVPEIGREALILISGALLAAALMNMWPAGRAYIKAAWQG